MKKNSSPTANDSQKTPVVRGHGTVLHPLPTAKMVERRARELAETDGRENVIDSDRLLAKEELVGSAAADQPADDPGIVASGFGSPPTSRGKMTARQLPTDDQTEAQTVEEGVDEAEHDTMVQASKGRAKSKP
jgi:hypothetical protein